MKRRTTRPYDATKRRENAAKARDRVLAAASRLFSKQGIDRVTIAEIAQSARVSTASVYAQFKSKAGLLEALAHSILLGPRYEATAKQVEGIDDPDAALRLTAAIARGIYQREHKELGLIRGAAAYSPALKKLEAGLEKVRRDLQEDRARLVFASNSALAELGLEKVRDLIWLFTGREFVSVHAFMANASEARATAQAFRSTQRSERRRGSREHFCLADGRSSTS
jgi:AcrR family transcriptional regulator